MMKSMMNWNEHHFMEVPKVNTFILKRITTTNLFCQGWLYQIGYIGEDGKEQVKEIIQKGDCSDSLPERITCVVNSRRPHKQNVSICAFNIDDFEKFIETPNWTRLWIQQAGRAKFGISKQAGELLNKDVKTRLVHFLWQLVEQKIGENTADGFLYSQFLTHEDIANLIGQAGKLLRQWRRAGNRRYFILRPEPDMLPEC